MKTEAQIKDFTGKKTYCECCTDFKNELKYHFEVHGLAAAQNYCKNYKNIVCPALDSFLYLS